MLKKKKVIKNYMIFIDYKNFPYNEQIGLVEKQTVRIKSINFFIGLINGTYICSRNDMFRQDLTYYGV